MIKKLLVFLIPLLFISGCTEQQQETVEFPTFDITPEATSNSYYNNGNFTITIIKQDDEILDWSTPTLSFHVKPNDLQWYNAEDYKTLFFTVEYDNRNIFSSADGIDQIKWSIGDNIWKVSGSKQFNVRKTINLTLELYLNIHQLMIEQTSTATIIFHDKDQHWKTGYNLEIKGIEL